MRTCPQCGFECDETHRFCPACGFPIGQISRDTDDPLIGRTLPGGYVILELVGIGGMGRVYRAEQTNLGRTVAVKIVHPHLVGEESAVARFITEARAASRLNHPNSVDVIDFGKTSDGQLYLVMEFLRGRDLARVAYEEGPLPFRRIIDVLRQVLAALDEAHHLGIIHRDLKPENIILEPMRAGGDFVKVVDFGLAKMRAEAQMPSITSPGIVCGTPEYMSPEQGRGDPLDARSDVYAVGVVLFQLLTGRLPFEAESPTQVVLMHLSKPPMDPRLVAPERQIPEPIVNVTLTALAKNPKERYGSAEIFAKALVDSLAEVDTKARPPTPSATKCGACGAMNAFGQKFCGECGQSTSPSLAPPPPSASPRISEPVLMPASQRKISAEHRLRFPLPLVGRDDDLAWLEQRRADARTGLSAARIIGDSGVGKTRLLREFLLICAAAGDTVVVTGPDPQWAEVSYYALRKTIRVLAGLRPDGGPAEWASASPEARQGLTDLFQPKSDESATRLRPEERRFAAAEALRWAIVRANERGKGRRVVLAFDDFQAIDGGSRNAIDDAVADPPLVPVMILATHTPEFSPDWRSDVPTPRILMGLPTSVVTKLLATNGSPSAPSMAGGRGISPLYLDQLVRFQREGGTGAPPRLADLIALRVERLSAPARRLLQALAVIGDEAMPATLGALLRENASLEEATSTLKAAGMVELDLETGALTSAHPLLRDVVLATIPAGARREFHEAAANWARAENAPIEVRAMHELHAHNSFEALVLLERVAVQCAARGDTSGNILALRRGLELARREFFRGELDDPMRAVLIFSRKLGEALAIAGALTDADGVLREALDMAGPSGPDRARVLGVLARVASGRSRNQEAQAYLREAIELATRAKVADLVTSLEELQRSLAS
ncbi:MAG: protein kinase [Myxococcales bacterium]|nr:protein kinase [Myxococcales bacterium]